MCVRAFITRRKRFWANLGKFGPKTGNFRALEGVIFIQCAPNRFSDDNTIGIFLFVHNFLSVIGVFVCLSRKCNFCYFRD